MKLLIITAFAAISFIPVSEAACVNGQEYVKGYTKKNGTVVKGYVRSCADGDKSNNFGKADYPGQHPARRDADKDGVPNYADRDDDNDGIHDNYDTTSDNDRRHHRDSVIVVKKPVVVHQPDTSVCRGRVYVKGHYRNGTWVDGYYRTCPDGDKNNNYGKAEYPGQPGYQRDADHDGIPNHMDRDDDNDGISDNYDNHSNNGHNRRYRQDPVIIIQDSTTESAL
jgi:hypothetical protein